MQEFLTYKNNGIRKFQQQKFSSAVSDFSHVINDLKVMGSDEAQLKMVCLINRSSCNLMLNKPNEAMTDANEAMNVYNTLRDEIKLNHIDAKKLKDDPLTLPLSLAYVRRGQVYEAEGDFYNAIVDYQVSDKLNPESDGGRVLKSVLKKLSIPEIKEGDCDGDFYKLRENLTNKEEIVNILGSEMMRLDQESPNAEAIEKYKKADVARLIFGVMQVYMHDQIVVLLCVAVVSILSDYGIKDVFNGFPVIRTALNEWRDNSDIVGECLNFIAMCPQELNEHLVDGQMIPTIVNAVNIELKEAEYDSAFTLLYRLATKKEHFKEIGGSNIIEIINKTKTVGGLILLSKLTQIQELAIAATKEGALEWIVDKLEQNKDNEKVVSAAAILAAQIFVVGIHETGKVVEVTDEDEEKIFEEKAAKIVKILFPIVKEKSKNATLVSNCYAAFAACVKYANSEIRKRRVIQAASATLQLHIENESVVMNIVSFFFACTQNGLKQEIKDASAVLPTSMQALQKHPSNQLLAERAVAIAVECESPLMENLVSLGLKQFPESQILRKYVNVINIERLRKMQQ